MNKSRGVYGITAEIFKNPKYDAAKVLHSVCQQIWKTLSGHRIEKGQQIHSYQSHRMAMPKNVQISIQFHSFHMIANLCSKSNLGFSII